MQYPRTEESPYPGVASHIPVLFTLLESASIDEVVEFGAGLYSTAMLGAWTKSQGMRYLTGENDQKWSPKQHHSGHSVFNVKDAMVIASTEHYNSTGNKLMFVDCEANLRASLVNYVLDETQAKWLVVHDTELMTDKAYGVRRPLLRWPNSVSIRCPYTAIETTVATRSDDKSTMELLKNLSGNPGLHSLRWELAQIFVRSHR